MSLTNQMTFVVGGLRGPGGDVTADLLALEANVVTRSAATDIDADRAEVALESTRDVLAAASNPPLRPAVWRNAVRNRYNSASMTALAVAGGGVNAPLVALAWDQGVSDRTGTEAAVYRVSGEATSAGAGPRFYIPITPADLARLGLVPDNTTPPRFSARAAIQRGSLLNQAVDAAVSGTTFLNGYWQVVLRYAGTGASLAAPIVAGTDVIYQGTAETPSSAGIGNAAPEWTSPSITGAQRFDANEKAMKRENVPLRASYGGQNLTGVILMFFGNVPATGPTAFSVGRVALVAGATIDWDEPYINLPEDNVTRLSEQNLDPALVTKVNGAASESPIAARITNLNDGTNPAAWALGMDQAWDFYTGLNYGGAVAPADTHAAVATIKGQAGYYTRVSANALVRAEAVGLQVAPDRIELISTPEDWFNWYINASGTGSGSKNRVGPDGAKNTAWTLTDSSAGDTYTRMRVEPVTSDTTTRTASMFVRKTKAAPASFPSIDIGYTGGTAKTSRIVIDPRTGKTLTVSPANATWRVSDAGEFWRVTGTMANNASGNISFYHRVTPAYAATLSVTGAATAQGSHVFAWGSIQVGEFATPPIPAGGNAAGNMVVSDQAAAAGQAVAGFATIDIKDPGAAGVRLFSLDDGTVSNYLAIEYVGGNAVLRLVTGGAEQAAVVLGQWRMGRQTLAFVAGPNYVWAQWLRSQSVAADTAATMPGALSKLGLGGNSASTAVRRANIVIEKLALRYGAADADTALEMLERASLAHGRVPEAWDNFDRIDSVDLGYAPTGHDWLQLPGNGAARVLAQISDKKVIAIPSGYPGVNTTAAYSSVQLRGPATHVRARVSWDPGTTGGGAALILTKAINTAASDVGWIVNDPGSVHIVFTDSAVNVGIFRGNDNFVLDTITYPTPMKTDGTIYDIGYDLVGNEIVIVAPGVAPIRLKHERLLNLAGAYVTWENFWTDPAQCRPRFHEVEAW